MKGAKMCTVLIIEDDMDLQEGLAYSLEAEGYSIIAASTMEEGEEQFRKNACDLILLDCNLPDGSGFEFCERIRRLAQTPVLMLTARDSELDEVKALNLGADDYLTKPFFTEELLARVRALSRRQGDVVLNELSFGDLTLNLSAYTLQCGAKSVRLGRKEFEVIRLLLSNPKIILSKETLLLKIWGSESEAEDNNVEAYISFLRKKLAFLHSTVQIATARKLGYHLEENAHAE